MPCHARGPTGTARSARQRRQLGRPPVSRPPRAQRAAHVPRPGSGPRAEVDRRTRRSRRPSVCASRPSPAVFHSPHGRAGLPPLWVPTSSASRSGPLPNSPRSGSPWAPKRCETLYRDCRDRSPDPARSAIERARDDAAASLCMLPRNFHAERSSVRGRSAGDPLAGRQVRRGESAVTLGRSALKARARQLTP